MLRLRTASHPSVATVVMSSVLPDGVRLHALGTHRDARGAFTELHRDEWSLAIRPVQWNLVSSRAGVLRGVHVHVVHADYLIIAAGRASIGLHDLRPETPTYGHSTLVEMIGAELHALVIPPGVAHGFYFHELSIHLYAVSHYWRPEDELGCLWSDPELRIGWPVRHPTISERDALLPPLAVLREQLMHARAPAVV